MPPFCPPNQALVAPVVSVSRCILRLRFLLVVLVTIIGIAAYLPYAFTARYVYEASRVLASSPFRPDETDR